MSETKKILIVEDEQDILAYFEAIFQDNGYDTVSAKDGIEGFERAKSEKPDLIALDITMPKQSGLKIYRQFKDPRTPPLFINILFNDIVQIMLISSHKGDENDKSI